MNREEIIQDAIANSWNVCDEYKTKTLKELKAIQAASSLPFAVCAFNVTGDLNLGIMMRTACLAGAERFIIYGKYGYDRRTTVGAHNYIDIVKAGSIDRGGSLEINCSAFEPTIRKFDYVPVFLETSRPTIYEYDPLEDIKTFGLKPCLVFGNEGMGLPEAITCGARHQYCIPQRGVLRSLNVCAAASIAIEYVSHKLISR